MPFKGFNSILFDLDSIVDIELSVLRYIADRYIVNGDSVPNWIDMERFSSWKDLSLSNMLFKRINGTEDLFQSLISDPEFKDQYYELMIQIWNRDCIDIFHDNYVVYTDILNLLEAYRIAGEGTISCTVRLDTEYEHKLFMRIMPQYNYTVEARQDVDMNKYGRIIIGGFRSAFEYKFNQPKSIVLLNYRDNFTEDNMKLLRPELVINFGDIHDLEIMNAYKDIQ